MPFWYGGMSIMPLLMPIIVGAVVYFLYKNGVFKELGSPMQSDGRANKSEASLTPLEILKRRYAEGEISTEEYRKMKEELKNG